MRMVTVFHDITFSDFFVPCFFFIIIFSNKYAYVFWKKDVFSIDFELIEKKFSVVLSPD